MDPIDVFQQPHVVGDPVTMRQLTEILIKHYGIHEGRYDLMVEFQLAMGSVGPDPSNPLPGASFAINRVGLTVANDHSVAPVDAAECNPPADGPHKARAKVAAKAPAKRVSKSTK